MSEQKIIEEVVARVEDHESENSEFFGLWNEWATHYRMIEDKRDRRPAGVSKNITAETPRAVNALASSITRMQTAEDPFFELRSDEADEETLFVLEKKYSRILSNLQFKRNLYKGNKGMCLFGSQVWEEPYVQYPSGTDRPIFQGTDFRPLSLLQCAFDPSVYDMNQSDFFSVKYRMTGPGLRFMAYSGNGFSPSGVWDLGRIEEGLKETPEGGTSGFGESAIDARRQRAGYQVTKGHRHELILWHGKLEDQDKNPVLLEMWKKFGRTDDIRFSDISFGILNRKHMVRLHPTPYGTWHHLYKFGHYEEFELEPYAYAVGKFGGSLQKWINNNMRYASDVAKFSMWNMFISGRGGGLKAGNLNVFPWSVIQADDISQIKELRPQIEGILNGIKLNEEMKNDFRGVTHATDTLQAIITGATAKESSLAQSEALRAVSVIAEINADSVIKPHLDILHQNEIDQNPFDAEYVKNVEFVAKTTTDKDYRPEHTKKLFDFLTVTTNIRQQMPIDFNPDPIIKYFARGVGINPRELRSPRPKIDRLLDVLKRVNADSQMKQAMVGEEASLNSAPPTSAEPSLEMA